MLGNYANPRSGSGHGAQEALMFKHLVLSRARFPSLAAPAAQRRPRTDLDLPPHAVAAGRLQLPALADLLGLWRRSDRAFWTLGRRMDDAGAAAALPALGYLRHRQCAADGA